jgi:hypothetical protein
VLSGDIIFKMSTRAPNPATGSRKISFNVSEQYDIQDVVGEGAYGVVWYVDSYGIVPNPCPLSLSAWLTLLIAV